MFSVSIIRKLRIAGYNIEVFLYENARAKTKLAKIIVNISFLSIEKVRKIFL